MVVTSKVLGLALLSTLGLAAPFEDNSIAARNADAVAEALLNDAEFDLEARDAEPEAEPEFEFDSEIIAREPEAIETYEQLFVSNLS
jgi:hypothetical protein